MNYRDLITCRDKFKHKETKDEQTASSSQWDYGFNYEEQTLMLLVQEKFHQIKDACSVNLAMITQPFEQTILLPLNSMSSAESATNSFLLKTIPRPNNQDKEQLLTAQ